LQVANGPLSHFQVLVGRDHERITSTIPLRLKSRAVW